MPREFEMLTFAHEEPSRVCLFGRVEVVDSGKGLLDLFAVAALPELIENLFHDGLQGLFSD